MHATKKISKWLQKIGLPAPAIKRLRTADVFDRRGKQFSMEYNNVFYQLFFSKETKRACMTVDKKSIFGSSHAYSAGSHDEIMDNFKTRIIAQITEQIL